MKREMYPILEFDPTKKAFIEPVQRTNLPSRLIICFFQEVINQLLENQEIIPVYTFRSEGINPIIYKFNDCDCGIVQGLLGAPACAGFLEEYIASGVNKVLFCGGGGVLRKDITLGRLVVVDKAVRDEGLSYHYLPPAREVEANKTVLKKITCYLEEHNIDFVVGKTWTTDAFYRETVDKIALRKEEACVIVEMEQSAMMAVAQFRNIEYGAIIYGGDDLTKEEWDSRNWYNRSDIRHKLTLLCKQNILTW